MQKNGIRNCEFIHGRVEDVLALEKGKLDLIVLDPPRTGCKQLDGGQIETKKNRLCLL
jgi:tRNA/tmRNA/rRNA uracil-C5-methylase (TrmA/RlmC/RlmD family)